MRIPSRLKPKVVPKLQVVPKPEPFRNIYFLNCVRCMGHGYFWTDPPQANPTVVFSRHMAAVHLINFWEDGLVSETQLQVVGDQINASSLPTEIPVVVEEFVRECMEWEVAVEKLASGNSEQSVFSVRIGMEVAEAVHEFLLEAQDRPELKTQ